MDWFLYDRELIGNFAENVLHVSERNIAKRSISLRRETERERDRENCNYFSFKHINLFSRLSKNTSPQTSFTLLCYA